MGPQYGRAVVRGVGGYSDFQASSGLGQATVAMTDSLAAIAQVTGNGANPGALTFDSFVRAMGARGYPASEVNAIKNLAWPFIPQKWRDRLSRREQPSAPTPVSPPASAPVHPSPQFPMAAPRRIPWGWIAAGVAALAAGGVVTYKLAKAKRR